MCRIQACLALLICGGILAAQDAVAVTRGKLSRAQQLVERNPSASRWIGLAEMRWAAGRTQAAIDALRRAEDEGRDLLCWRAIELREATPKAEPSGGWHAVASLYLALQQEDRPALLRTANLIRSKPPAAFPSVKAERHHLALLVDLGMTQTQAALEVLAARSVNGLLVLRELDQGLTREWTYHQQAGLGRDALRLLACRDVLREAYLKNSRHIGEREFALDLSDQVRQRDELREQVKRVDYLHDRKKLAAVVERIGENQAWKLVLETMLDSDLALLSGPNLKGMHERPLQSLAVRADNTEAKGDLIIYQGNVQAKLGHVELRCPTLIYAKPGALIGSGAITLRGIAGFAEPIQADRCTYSADSDSFTLGGDVRLPRWDQTLKVRSCTLKRNGTVSDVRTLLQDFSEAEMPERLELLPRIAKVYRDDELPDDVRYLLALHTLRPHLRWHAPYLPPRPNHRVQYERAKHLEGKGHDVWRWEPALGGEEWMHADIPASVRQGLGKLVAQRQEEEVKAGIKEGTKMPELSAYFWRIADPQHADVARAIQLLEGIQKDELGRKARHWLEEIKRNNTVITGDVPGAYTAGRDAPVVLDVRNADRLSFQLYRVHKPDELLWVLDHIGNDFVFHDHGLQYPELLKKLGEAKDGKGAEAIRRSEALGSLRMMPEGFRHAPLRKWETAISDMKRLQQARRRHRWYRDEESRNGEDGEYFEDDCRQFEARLERRYWPENGQLSSWQCGLIAEVPGAELKEAGAYVLRVEANGQSCYLPLLVDPPAVTLRRCRDGVFVMAAEPQGNQPLSGATVHARNMVGEVATDREGVAFARVFARGDRAIVVQHKDQFAVGGFGRVFEGIYRTPLDELDHKYRSHRELAMERATGDGHLYSDRHIIAVYTDRPTYRPDQDVQFKLIVRLLGKGNPPNKEGRSFRAEEFESNEKLELPASGTRLHYVALNPRGQAVGEGDLTLNDYGTAAGTVKLNKESATGIYSLRMELAGIQRIVPDVFAVRYYRRPNAKLEVQGVPEKLAREGNLDLEVTGRYYTGQPVAGGRIEIELVAAGERHSLAEVDGKLDASGKTRLRLALPKELSPGAYVVQCHLRDESEQTVTHGVPLVLEGQQAAGAGSVFEGVPRFVPLDQPLVLTTGTDLKAAQVRYAEVKWTEAHHRFAAKDGKVTVRWPATGWWTLTNGREQREIFVFGGTDAPFLTDRSRYRAEKDEMPPLRGEHAPRFVNLSDYQQEQDRERHGYWPHSGHLLALLDRQRGKLGENLRLLVYTPGNEARILLTVEGRTIRDYTIFRVKSTTSRYHVLEIPLRERHLPHFYLQGRIVWLHRDEKRTVINYVPLERLGKSLERTGDGEDPRWCRIDVQAPPRLPHGETLRVEINPDKAEYAPGSTVTVEMKATNTKGKPVEAELSLAAVDESVHAFDEDRVGGLAALFGETHLPQPYYRKSWRVSRGFRKELLDKDGAPDQQDEALRQLAELVKQSWDGKAGQGKDGAPSLGSLKGERLVALPLLGEMPSGSVPLARLRQDFRETATWQPQLRTGPNGIARTTFRLPDSLTAYRLTAVALTRDTEIGTAKTTVRAQLPLAVQVFLPRFAIEKDRLQAVGVIRNNTSRERTCELTWDVSGAILEDVAADAGPKPEDWKLTVEGNRKLGRGRVRVPANGSVRVAVWLSFKHNGTARVSLRSQDGPDGDAEVRTLPVQPLGRERNLAFEGAFKGTHKVALPAGFVARDLQIVIARGELAQALDGIGYLIDYPYGCVEQTMSRFLPAVVVQQATKQAPITLPPDALAKLPKVLDQGLQRLYHFQHGDGGWGWWENDATNPDMTVYVVMGLVRAQAAGVRVDADVLSLGCDCLKQLLQQGKLPGSLGARAWLALTLAGRVERAAVQAEAERLCIGEHPAEERGYLVLACRARGLLAEASQLFARMPGWQPETTELLALKLQVEMACGVKLEECQQTAARLVKRRQGLHWESTRATAAAIEALAPMMRYLIGSTTVKSLRVLVGGKRVLELRDAKELSPLVYRLQVAAEMLPRGEGAEVELQVDSEVAILFTLSASGTQQLDRMEPIGTSVRMQRQLETLDGKPLHGPVKPGDVIAVRLRIELDQAQSYLIVEDRRPAGCEYADERISSGNTPASLEFRDDRLCVFFNQLPAGKHEIVYWLRAETAGASHFLPGVVYPMYQESARGETGATRLEVKR
jgi:hypothetical protein